MAARAALIAAMIASFSCCSKYHQLVLHMRWISPFPSFLPGFDPVGPPLSYPACDNGRTMNSVVNALNAPLHPRLLAGTAPRGFSTAPTARPNFAAAATPNARKPGEGAVCWGCPMAVLVQAGGTRSDRQIAPPGFAASCGFSRIFPEDFSERHPPDCSRKWLKINDRTFWPLRSERGETEAAPVGLRICLPSARRDSGRGGWRTRSAR